MPNINFRDVKAKKSEISLKSESLHPCMMSYEIQCIIDGAL